MERLLAQLQAIADRLVGDGAVPVRLERPRSPEHGDFASNLAMMLAGRLGRPPRQVAEEIIGQLDLAAAGLVSAEIAGPGFINFRLASGQVTSRVTEIIEADRGFGRSHDGNGRRVQVEFVSANPTGPLHVAHGRGAALGDAIASLLAWTGHDVQREFYVNDAGLQIDRLAESLEARWLEATGTPAAIPEGGYHGDYLREMAADLEAARGDELRAMDADVRRRFFRDHATNALREEQDATLRTFGVVFDEYYSESTLYREGRLEDTLAELKRLGLTYESDGAVWLRTSEFGDDKDRVLVKSDGSFTYFLPDIAYHREKARRGFDHVIDV
ncbi:MAG TPA: arginine--tRNA ligase, partial [Longimicrobiales bacterium]|nr:arginine--tRNA ligase [Longimicrobiales bacterium]